MCVGQLDGRADVGIRLSIYTNLQVRNCEILQDRVVKIHELETLFVFAGQCSSYSLNNICCRISYAKLQVHVYIDTDLIPP